MTDIPTTSRDAARQLEMDLRQVRSAEVPGFDAANARAGLQARLRAGNVVSLPDRGVMPRERRARSWPVRLLIAAATLGVAAGAIAAISVALSGPSGGQAPPSSPTSEPTQPPARAPRAPQPAPIPSARLTPEAPPVASATSRPRAAASERNGAVDAPAVKDDLIQREVAQMKEVRSLLETDPARALALADAGNRAFARGILYHEREAHAVLALVRLGERESARRRAELFLKRSPNGPLSQRVREAIGMR